MPIVRGLADCRARETFLRLPQIIKLPRLADNRLTSPARKTYHPLKKTLRRRNNVGALSEVYLF
jgi:hypothetical protein